MYLQHYGTELPRESNAEKDNKVSYVWLCPKRNYHFLISHIGVGETFSFYHFKVFYASLCFIHSLHKP